ncbi:MAG: hypothetical protein RBG13Loki_3101 [Promethearchaeota archaeon CR_4]|nr:MAG: hypothetical protein RBG13Loki_3101 [Candidatus Lokiarchaeota archaeon CR_4]
MDSDVIPPPRDESHIDLTLSWRMFRQNAKPFLATQGIALGGVIGFAVVISILLSVFGLETSSGSNPEGILTIQDFFVLFLQVPSLLIFLAFQGSLFGLAFDVMSSGDQFTELGGTFRYLGKFWRRYLLFGFFLNLPTICLVIIGVSFGGVALAHLADLIILFTPISFVVFVIFVQAGPALTTQSDIKSAFKDNFQTLRTALRRLLKTWIIFWIIFYLPYFITNLLVLAQINAFMQGDLTGLYLLVLALITEMWYFFAGVPVQTLTATRIFNSLHLAPPREKS